MQTTQAVLKAQIAALVQKAANIDEAEKNEPELDMELTRLHRHFMVQIEGVDIDYRRARFGQPQHIGDLFFVESRLFHCFSLRLLGIIKSNSTSRFK